MTTTPAGAVPRQDGPAPSWRDRLAAKQRRRIVVPILTSADDGGLLARAESHRTLVELLSKVPGDDDAQKQSLARARADLAAAEAAVDEHVVRIPFVSLPPAEFDALMAAHPATDLAHDGGIDWHAALPALAAACCAEPDAGGAEDVAWWTSILSQPEWTKGDLLSLWGALLRLHTRAPSVRVPFA